MTDATFTTFQIAKICGVRPTTIITWIKEKKIKAYVTPGGHRRVSKADLIHFLKEFGFPIPSTLSPERKVLIVEDDPNVGLMLQKSLINVLGDRCEVQWIKDGMGALLLMGDHPVDLIFLDVVMPGMDGAQLLSTIRSDDRTKNIKVIGMTGNRLDDDKLVFMKSHTEAFFNKPFDVNQAVEKAVSLLDLQ